MQKNFVQSQDADQPALRKPDSRKKASLYAPDPLGRRLNIRKCRHLIHPVHDDADRLFLVMNDDDPAALGVLRLFTAEQTPQADYRNNPAAQIDNAFDVFRYVRNGRDLLNFDNFMYILNANGVLLLFNSKFNILFLAACLHVHSRLPHD